MEITTLSLPVKSTHIFEAYSHLEKGITTEGGKSRGL